MTDVLTASADTLDADLFREVLGHYPSGLTVVTGVDADGPIGFTCQSFYSVSLEPALISFCVSRTSTSYPRLRPTGRFAINVLAHTHADLSRRFARSGTDKWSGIEWEPSAGGNPVLPGITAWMDCDVWSEHEAGDHLIVVGHVRELVASSSVDPLVYYRAGYHRLTTVAATA